MTKKNIIKSITLRNFMCHSNLKLTFSSPITVIGGFNGSGKSAIMIAIGIILGQRTTALDRGSSAKSLIQNGKSIASIQLVLSNEQHRFNHGFFGNSVIFEKSIKRDGTHTLRIKNDAGRVFSTKKEDLDFIMEYFHLHIDNPLNFLTQENSKKFLKTTKPENLYKLFMQGTELDDVAVLHEEASKKTTEMKVKLDVLNEELAEINVRRKKKATDLNIVAEGNNMDQAIAELKVEIEWYRLKLMMDDIQSRRADVKAYTRDIEKFDEKIREDFVKIEELRKEEEEKEQEIKRLKVEFDDRRKMLLGSIKNCELEEREMKSDLMEIVKGFDEKVERLRNLRRLGGIDKLAEKKVLLEEKLKVEEAHTQKLEILTKKLDEESLRVGENKEKLAGLRQKESNVSKQIDFLKKIEKNKVLFFHSRMSEILRNIKSTRFDDEFMGPIGSYIHLKEFKWNKALSIILRNILSNFVVFNKNDKTKLKKIFERYDANFSILIPSSNKNTLIDYQKVENYKTAMDVIEVDHRKKNIVLNQLIILANLERIILVDDRTHAYSILKKEEKYNRKFPIISAYTEEGDKISIMNGSLTDFRARMSSMYFEQNLSKLKLLQSEHKKVFLEMEGLIETKKSEDLHKQVNELGKLLGENRRIISDLKLETALEIGDDIDAEVNALQTAIESLRTQKEELEDSIKKVVNSKIKATREIKENVCASLPELGLAQSGKIERFFIENNILEKKIQQVQIKLNRKQDEIIQFLGKYEPRLSDLKKKHPEIKEPRNEALLKEKIQDCEIKKEVCQRLESEEILKSDLSELTEMFDHKRKLIMSYEQKVKETLKNILLRIQKREKLKNEVGHKVAKKFGVLTAKRNYEGLLEFDHDKRLLDLKMKVNIRAGDKSTLSGGERSFAAMCLILSMWSFISCPVKILDEFDVFMDSLNRDTVLQELIQLFKESELQIILITPLSMKIDSVDFIMLEHPNRT